MPTMKEVKCSHCNNLFEVTLKKYNVYQKNNWKFYCSPECNKESRKTGQYYKCATCGKDVWKTPSQVARSKTGNVFCNKTCATITNNTLYKSGENNPNYTNGLASYRVIALKAYDNKCAICGYEEEVGILEVHHLDQDRSNNMIENLIILCPNCHRKITLGIEEKKK